MRTLYDLYVIIKWKTTPELHNAAGAILENAWSRYPLDTVHGGLQINDVRGWLGGIMYLGLQWEDAWRYAHALRMAKGAGILVPVAYRTPRISPAEGAAIARIAFDRLRDPDAVYQDEESSTPVDDYCWWRYPLVNLTAQAAHIIPGILYVWVHKLTGEVSSSKEVVDWIVAHAID